MLKKIAILFFSLWVLSPGQECPELVTSPLIVISRPFPINGLTVTNFSLDWFETGGVSFFDIIIPDGLGMDTLASAGRLKLGVFITGRAKGSSKPPVDLVDVLYRVSPTQVGRPVPSEEVFDMPKEEERTFVDESTLDQLSDTEGRLLPVFLDAKFSLTCLNSIGSINWQTTNLNIKFFDGTIDPSLQVIDAISPGNLTPQKPAVIQEEFPNFIFNTGLASKEIRYPAGETKFILYLTEIQSGESPLDAVLNNSVPFLTLKEGDVSTFAPYPSGKPPLKEGVLYGWRVAMRLRGPQDKLVYSKPLFFRFSRDPNLISSDPFHTFKTIDGFVSLGDDYTRRLLAALKIILGENYEVFLASLGSRIPVKGQIRWNGQPYSLEQLEKLARAFSRKSNSLTRLRFRQ